MPDTQHGDSNTPYEGVKRLTPLKRKRGHHPKRLPKVKSVGRIIGIDGEGQGRFPHLYNYLAASDESGKTWDVAAPSLSTEQCLDFLVSLPEATVVAFSFGYDLTKVLSELTDKKLHKLLHPERRRKKSHGKVIYQPVRWGNFKLNYMNGRFSVAKWNGEKYGKSTVVWDIWRFFQSRFVQALLDWGIATKDQLAYMQRMKDRRGYFEHEDSEEVQRYCREECQRLAQLFRALIEAHEDADLKLKSYFGAGSTSTALLTKMGIKEQVRTGPDDVMRIVPWAFSAGRFENAHIGPVCGPLHDSDISSAYPYHATQLPCLAHGSWSRADMVVDADISAATLALVRWTAPHAEPVGMWGPFPVRTKEGSIIYPWSAVGGWVWGKEYLAGKRLCPHVQAREAWLYHTSCDCRPFKDLPTYYLERIRVGKGTGRGKVFKLGPNGVYGKLAQTVGHNPPFQSFIWAGVITSNTRAQLLDAIASNPRAVLAVATDGILSTERLSLPAPVDTGTSGVEFPLGGWEQTMEGGRFLCRPGISFPLDVPIDRKGGKTKSRGYSKKAIEEQCMCILEAWEHGHELCVVDDGEQFGSALGMIHMSQSGYSRSELYGEWFRTYTVMSFDPAPKRVKVPGSNRLGLICNWPEESLPYDPAKGEELEALT